MPDAPWHEWLDPRELTATDWRLFEAFSRLAAHYRRSPTLTELAAYVERAPSTTHGLLRRLVRARVLVREAHGRYRLP